MGKHILIVESGIPVVPFEQSLLLRKEHDIIRAATGDEAINHLQQLDVDLMISDERLSDMDAVDLARNIRDLPNGQYLSIMVLGNPVSSLLHPHFLSMTPVYDGFVHRDFPLFD